MNRISASVALTVSLIASTAAAQLESFVGVCGDPNASARDVVRMCQKALDTGQLRPTASAQVGVNLGIGHYELGEYDRAVAAYSTALQSAPNMIDLYLNRARAYEKLRRLTEAGADYDAALRIDRSSPEVYQGRGVMLLAHGDPGRAIKDFDRVISLKPQWISNYFNRGVAHYQVGNYKNADQDFSTVIRHNPSDAGAYLNRARTRAALGRSDAMDDFNTALEVDPEWGGGWFARGKYHDATGNREAANQDFLRAFELGYPDPWLNQRVREISG